MGGQDTGFLEKMGGAGLGAPGTEYRLQEEVQWVCTLYPLPTRGRGWGQGAHPASRSTQAHSHSRQHSNGAPQVPGMK